MSDTAEFGTWVTFVKFKDGSTYRIRGLVINGVPGFEERIFNADGTLRPLPDGRKSHADTNP